MLAIFFSSLLIGLSGAVVPGPLLALTVDQSSRLGVVGGLAVVTGHVLVELLLVAAFLGGLAGMFSTPGVTGGIGLIGGIVLIRMGYGMLGTSPNLHLSSRQCSHPASRREYLAALGKGMLFSVTNPYWSIWWATVGLTYFLLWADNSVFGVFVFFVGHILADYLWYSLVTIAVVIGFRLISGQAYRKVVAFFGFLLIGFGLYFVYGGVTVIL